MLQRGLRDEGYDVMVSYRQAANSKFVAMLVDVLQQQICQQTRAQLAVFYDQISLQLARPFILDFCTGVANSLVVVPIISVQAMRRFVLQADATEPDYMLVEWYEFAPRMCMCYVF